MTYRAILALAGASMLLAGPAHGYSQLTHLKLSRGASATSVLSAPGALLRLGIKSTDMFPSADIDGIAAPAVIIPQGCREEDYRFGELNVSNHFFDPANGGAGLHPCNRDILGVVGLCIPSPDWVLEDNGRIPRQDASFLSAREALFHALKDHDPAQFGRMFDALGHVIHHLQDMAQPQHTRNDWHIPPDKPFGSAIRGAYELTTEATYGIRLRDEPDPDVAASVVQQNLAAIHIRVPRDLWIDDDDGVPVLNGRGIAEYSNRNFVTAGTNFTVIDRLYADQLGTLRVDAEHDAGYALPSGFLAFLTPVTYGQEINDAVPEVPISEPPADARIYWVGTNEFDGLLEQFSSNSFTSKLALNAEDLLALPAGAVPGAFSLGIHNYREARTRLLPKAVAYSAALLNYFFRGTIAPDGKPALRFSLESFGAGSSYMNLTNTTNEGLHDGTLQVFYDAADGRRKRLGEPLAIPIPAHQTVTIPDTDIPWQTLWTPERASHGSIVLVYVGSMEAEQAPPGVDPSEYAVASRVCTCPPQFDGNAPISPNDPQLECEEFCCQYLSYYAGYPGVPGDGRTIPGYITDFPSYFPLYPPLQGDSLTNGLTITVFPVIQPGVIQSGFITGAKGNLEATCGCSYPYADYAAWDSFRPVTVNNVTGYSSSIPQWVFTNSCPLDYCGGSNSCGCGESVDYIRDELLNITSCWSNASNASGSCNVHNVPIDAIAICRDENMFPE